MPTSPAALRALHSLTPSILHSEPQPIICLIPPALTQESTAKSKTTFKSVALVALVKPKLQKTKKQATGVQGFLKQSINWAQEKLCEIGKEQLLNLQRADLKIQASESAGLGLKLREQLFEPESEFVKSQQSRRFTSEKWSGQSIKHYWSQTTGLTEMSIGTRPSGTLNLPFVGISAGIGFECTGAIQYRILIPVRGDIKNAAAAETPSIRTLPFTLEEALKLEPGTEVEFTGYGTLGISGSVGLGQSLSIGIASASAETALSAGIKATGFWSIRATRQLGTQVDISIFKHEQSTEEEALYVKLGLSVEQAFGISSPWGSGLIQSILNGLVQNKTQQEIILFFDSLSEVLHASLGTQENERRSELARYHFHAEHPCTATAFKRMFYLDSQEADLLCGIENSGVSASHESSLTARHEKKADLELFKKKIFLAQTLKLESKSLFINSSGRRSIIWDIQTERTLQHPTAIQHVNWQSIHVQSDDGKAESFYRFHFDKTDYITSKSELGPFLTLAQNLGIASAQDFDWKTPDLSMWRGYFSASDDSNVNVDIFLSAEGMKNIDTTNYQEAIFAYFQAFQSFHPEIKKFQFLNSGESLCKAIKLLKRYEIRHNWFHTLCRFPKPNDICLLYAILSQGRNFDHDISELKIFLNKADTFASRVGKLNVSTQGREGLCNFWSNFKDTNFDFMPSISALVTLAGRKECLVHKLSLAGKNSKFESENEGTLTCELYSEHTQEFGDATAPSW